MKYKVGDKVRVREDLEVNKRYEGYLFSEDMEKYKGNKAIIKYDLGDGVYQLDIDNDSFNWVKEMLEPIAESIAESDENTDEVVEKSVESIEQFTKEDLKFGDIITLRNGDKLTYTGIATMRNSEDMEFGIANYDSQFNYDDNSDFDIMKVERHIYEKSVYYKKENIYKDIYALQTLYERKEEILTEKEKEYLSAVIKPFRNRKFAISKIQVYDKKSEFIFIEFSEDEYMAFPYFDKGTMYKNMEIKKDYTLEELEL